MKKRFLSVMLAAVMTFSAVPLTSYGALQQGNVNFCITEDETHATGAIALSQEEEETLLRENNIPIINSAREYYEQEEIAEGTTSANDNMIAEKLPNETDNSKSVYFPAIGNQGSVPSCTSWAVSYYMATYMIDKAMNRAADQNATVMSPRWTYNMTNSGQFGGTSYIDAIAILNQIGANTIDKVPVSSEYKSWTPVKDVWENSQQYKIDGCYGVSIGAYDIQNPTITSPDDKDLEAAKTALSNGDILIFTTDVYRWRYEKIVRNSKIPANDSYAGQYIMSHADSSSSGGWHCMTIVGYNDNIWVDINKNGKVEEGEKGAFKIANSWGKSWKNNGYVWVSYDALNNVSSVGCKSEYRTNAFRYAEGIYVSDVHDNTADSGMHLVADLNTANRNVDEITIKAVNKTGGQTYSYKAAPFSGITYNTGKYSLNGKSSEDTGTIVLDLKNVVADINSDNYNDYFWSVTAKGSMEYKLGVENFRIEDKISGLCYGVDVSSIKVNDSAHTFSISTVPENMEDVVTIYYDDYSTPFCHYQVANSSWTLIPGYEMASAHDDNRAARKIVLRVNKGSVVKACFNDGNGSWDNNNGNNYMFTKGEYQVKDGKIINLDNSNTVTIYYRGYDNPNIHYQIGNSSWTAVPGVKMEKSDEYTGYGYKVSVNLESNTVLKACFNDGNGNWDNNNGNNYTFSAGTYTFENGVITDLNKSKIVTIYYKGYNNPNIHYKIGNGSWTSVPGYAMTTVSNVPGYTHKAVIPIGNADGVTACFNDGYGNWDSNNQANYYFTAGVNYYQS